jgi:hypothetical protein
MPGSLSRCGSAASYTACQAGGSAAIASARPAKAGSADSCNSCCQELSGSHAAAGFGRGLNEPASNGSTRTHVFCCCHCCYTFDTTRFSKVLEQAEKHVQA